MQRPEPLSPTRAATLRARARHAGARSRGDAPRDRTEAGALVADGSPGRAALAELRAALAGDDSAPDDVPKDGSPVPLDEQVAPSAAGRSAASAASRSPAAAVTPPPQGFADPALALSDFHDLRRLGLRGRPPCAAQGLTSSMAAEPCQPRSATRWLTPSVAAAPGQPGSGTRWLTPATTAPRTASDGRPAARGG